MEKMIYLLFSRISGNRKNYWPDIRPNQYPVQPYLPGAGEGDEQVGGLHLGGIRLLLDRQAFVEGHRGRGQACTSRTNIQLSFLWKENNMIKNLKENLWQNGCSAYK